MERVRGSFLDHSPRRWTQKATRGGACVGDDVYLAGFDHRVYAFDPVDGEPRWSHKTESHLNGAPVVGPEDRIYAVSRDLHLYVLDARDGAVVDRQEVGGSVSGPAVDGQGDAYVSTLDAVSACRVHGAAPRWRFTDPQASMNMLAAPTLSPDQDTLYAPGAHGRMYALRTEDGTKKWEFTARNGFFSPAEVRDGTVFVGCFDHRLYAIDASSGQESWSYPTGGPVNCRPSIADGVVFFTSHDGKVYALDAASGDLKWSRPLGGRLTVTPVPGPEGTVVVGGQDGVIHVLDRTTGDPRWEIPLDGATTDGVVLSADGSTIYCPTEQGQLLALDNRSPSIRAEDALRRLDRKGPAIEPAEEWVTIDGIRVPKRPTPEGSS